MANDRSYKKETLVIEHLGINAEIKYSRLDAKKEIEKVYTKVLIDPNTRQELERRLVAVDPAPMPPRYSKTPAEHAGGGVATAPAPVSDSGARVFKTFYKDDPSREFLGEAVEIIRNKFTGNEVDAPDSRFLRFRKLVDKAQIGQFFVEDTYTIWSDNTPAMLRLAEDLSNTGQVALFDWCPTGSTVFYGFLYPVYDAKITSFHLLMATARLKMTSILGEGMKISDVFDLQDKLKMVEEMEDR